MRTLSVHDHCFMPDRLHIDVHVAAKKMFRLRIVGAAEHFFNKNLPPACCDEHPENALTQQRRAAEAGEPRKQSEEADYFLKSSAPFLSAYTYPTIRIVMKLSMLQKIALPCLIASR